MSEQILIYLHFVSTLIMIGIIWFVQVVHYPLMAYVGIGLFSTYSRLHQKLTTLVVAIPMLAELFTAVLLLVSFPTVRSSAVFWSATILLGIIWVSTIFRQMPIHHSLLAGYDEQQIQRLVRTNWLRTFAWSIRGILVGELCWSMTVQVM
ncbi:hypothetical protein [Bythopirellula polymerisocia]|uniref:hypothetical protein n=1 Tax=Bythopirellula polymerisocia TaxID=2528003 RepID=UPI0011B58F25|nr:hypothetical protein [Bythopirellula polymerisocia]